MDIFDALLQSHTVQRSLAERLLGHLGDAHERDELFAQLKAELDE